MLDSLKDLAKQLTDAPLVSDEFGNDFEHATVAIQAMTALMVTRDVRARMARWERVGSKLVLRPENPPTQEEIEANERRLAEMIEARQGPAVSIFDPNSTRLRNPDGSQITSRAQYEAAKKAKGVEEVSRYDFQNDVGVTSETEKKAAEEARIAEMFKRAKQFGQQTGQITADGQVVANAPVIPMPVVERPDAIKPKPAAEVPDNRPAFENIPVEKRTRVDPAKQFSMIRSLTSRAAERAAAVADARKVHPVLANGGEG